MSLSDPIRPLELPDLPWASTLVNLVDVVQSNRDTWRITVTDYGYLQLWCRDPRDAEEIARALSAEPVGQTEQTVLWHTWDSDVELAILTGTSEAR